MREMYRLKIETVPKMCCTHSSTLNLAFDTVRWCPLSIWLGWNSKLFATAFHPKTQTWWFSERGHSPFKVSFRKNPVWSMFRCVIKSKCRSCSVVPFRKYNLLIVFSTKLSCFHAWACTSKTWWFFRMRLCTVCGCKRSEKNMFCECFTLTGTLKQDSVWLCLSVNSFLLATTFWTSTETCCTLQWGGALLKDWNCAIQFHPKPQDMMNFWKIWFSVCEMKLSEKIQLAPTLRQDSAWLVPFRKSR